MSTPLPQRKPTRLPDFDYSSHGAYFVTICTHEKENTLCTIVGDGFPVPAVKRNLSASVKANP